jgi:hypothetical protein
MDTTIVVSLMRIAFGFVVKVVRRSCTSGVIRETSTKHFQLNGVDQTKVGDGSAHTLLRSR